MIVDETNPPAEGQTSDNYLMTKYKRIRALCMAAASLLSVEDTRGEHSSRQQLKNHAVKRPLMQYLREIEKEAISQAPIDVGKAVATTAGTLPCIYVIHAPTMKQPAMRISVENVKHATQAALKLGVELKLKSIAIPGMGTGVGRVPVEDAAKAIVSIAKEFENKFEKIVLIDRNEDMVDSYNRFL